MTTGAEVDSSEHLVRNCKAGWVGEDRRPLATAFMLRKGEGELSVTSIERVSKSDDKTQQLRDVRAALHRGGFMGTKNTWYATITAQAVTSATFGDRWTRQLRVESQPDANEGHCLIFEMPEFGNDAARHVGLELATAVLEPAVPEAELV